MRIGIEAQRIFRPDKHGMDFVILEVLRQLQYKDKENEYVVFVAPGQDHCIESTERMHILELKCPPYPLWEQWVLPHAVANAKVDLLHCTSNTAPLHCSVPLVLTLHDIIWMALPALECSPNCKSLPPDYHGFRNRTYQHITSFS